VGDIPGIREFGLWQVEPEDVDGLFPEFRDLLGSCQFRDCRHIHEPGCAIKAAVESGELDRRRYESYLRIREAP
jgi:ribosome biogenesis GTPase